MPIHTPVGRAQDRAFGAFMEVALARKSTAVKRTKFDSELSSGFKDTAGTSLGKPAAPVGSLPGILFFGNATDLSTGTAFDCRCC